MVIEAPPKTKFRIIREMTMRDDNLLNISWLCKIAGVSRSGYYNWLASEGKRNDREEHDRADFALVLAAYQFRGYDKGARGIYMRLIHQMPPVIMNIKKIRRLMNKYGLKCPIRKANPYRRMAKALRENTVAPYLLERKFRAYGPRMVLLTDITYLLYGFGGKSYLSTILDAYTKQILAYAVSDSLEVDFVLNTMNQLIRDHGISLQAETIINSDQGIHYTSYKFIQLINNINLRQSMSRKANCWDNAPQESFFGHMKDEIDISRCQTHTEVCTVIDDWIDYYNNDRYQWDLSRLSPNEYYEYVCTGKYPLNLVGIAKD
ncbi:MAG: IS3 family transposase [Christensenellaceae bacterium]|jgi:putative transposase